MEVQCPRMPQGTSKNKSQGEGLLCIAAGTDNLSGRWALEQKYRPPQPRAPPSQSSTVPTSPQAMCPALTPQTERALPSSILHEALQTLSACLICWTSQLRPITEYKLIQPSKEAAENTGGSRGHHCTSKHQLLCAGSLYTT